MDITSYENWVTDIELGLKQSWMGKLMKKQPGFYAQRSLGLDLESREIEGSGFSESPLARTSIGWRVDPEDTMEKIKKI